MKETLYGKIYHELLGKIKSGELAPGARLPTEHELMAQYGVSRITAIRAMKELEKDLYIYRRQKSGSFVRDYLHTDEGALKNGALIPVILPFERNPGLGIMFGAQAAASTNALFTTFFHTQGNIKTERKILEKVLDMDIAGLVFCGNSAHENLDLLSRIYLKKTPIVLVDQALPGISLPLVTSDNEGGMREVVEHLLRSGHTRIAYFPYFTNMSSTERLRFAGYCKGFLENGHPIPCEYLYTPVFGPNARPSLVPLHHRAEYHKRYISATIAYYRSLPAMPTAIVCTNDVIAYRLIRALREEGYRVPEDISVTGFDNYDFPEPAVEISTVEQDWHNLGAIAIEHIVAMIEGKSVPPVTRLQTRFIEKKTTCPH